MSEVYEFWWGKMPVKLEKQGERWVYVDNTCGEVVGEPVALEVFRLAKRVEEQRAEILAQREMKYDALKRVEVLGQAVGLATTAVPSMEMDADDPIGMMHKVVAETTWLREALEATGHKLCENCGELAPLHSKSPHCFGTALHADMPTQSGDSGTKGRHLAVSADNSEQGE